MNMNSILNAIKKQLGIEESYIVFDADIIMAINSVFLIFHQLGLGPAVCYRIEDENNTWDEFTDSPDMEAIKTLMYMRVKLMFDPPQSSSLIDAYKLQIAELEWRLNLQHEDGETTL